jgi:septal ring factor EnvC (AmiA/AmiB activator)
LYTLTYVSVCVLANGAAVRSAENGAALNDLRQRISSLESALEDDSKEVARLRASITTSEKSVIEARAASADLHAASNAKRAAIETLNIDIATLTGTLGAKLRETGAILSARYVLAKQPKIRYLLGEQNVYRSRRHMRYYEHILAATNTSLYALNDDLSGLREMEFVLKLEMGKLQQLEFAAGVKANELQTAITERRTLIESVELALRGREAEIEQLRSDEARLQRLVDEIADSYAESIAPADDAGFAALKGALDWPTDGKIVKTPGGAMRTGGAKWSGVVIESEPGEPIRAIAPGTVVFADWFRNLGLLLIIDHGDGYMSLYGHNRRLHKVAGDNVVAGETIAAIGDTGGQTRGGLYFEIRRDGVAQDPRLWCAKR